MKKLKIFLLLSCFNVGGCFSFIKNIEKKGQTFEEKNPTQVHAYMSDQQKINYISSGKDSASPVIFVHGSPGSWEAWVEYIEDEQLQKKSLMMAIDRPGYGKSNAGKPELSLAKQAAALKPLLDKYAGAHGVILVGHSFGGPIIVQAAADDPSQIKSLIILAGDLDPELEKIKWYQYPATWPVINWFVPQNLDVCNREIMAVRPELEKLKARLAGIHTYVTVIHGDKDDLVPYENAEYIKKNMTGSEVHVMTIPGMNHFLPWNKYDIVKSVILEHIDRSSNF